jgi:hypothetical protein
MARFLLIVVLAAPLMALAVLLAAEPSASVAPLEGVLLHRNGSVFAGKVTRDGERFFVALPHGEIRVEAGDVRWVGRSLSECYQFQQSAVTGGNVIQHLDLAAWCIKNGLLNEARQELAEAARLDPRHPKLPLLERKLKSAEQGPPPRAPETSAAPASKDAAPAAEELDTLVRDLPSSAVETFTASIQPMLQNHCGAAGCHGPTSTSAFRLQRLPRKGPVSPRLTLRNLHAAMQTIDREKPGNSPLLQTPIKPHAAGKEAVFKTRDASQYRQLVAWVYQVANSPPPRSEPAETEPPPLLQQSATAPAKASAANDPAPKQAQAVQPPSSRPAQGEKRPHGATTAKETSTVVTPGAVPGMAPGDPFDPEPFNRRYFPDRRSSDQPRQVEHRANATSAAVSEKTPGKSPNQRRIALPWAASPGEK